MSKNKAIVVVGHSDWGKSKTLKALTGGNIHKVRVNIKGYDICIKRMSNDDEPEKEKLLNYLQEIDPNIKPIILITLCPDFDDSSKKTNKILKLLSNKYNNIFFWVLKRKYGSIEEVSNDEIQMLKSFGKVSVFSDKAEASDRALELERFIKSVL